MLTAQYGVGNEDNGENNHPDRWIADAKDTHYFAGSNNLGGNNPYPGNHNENGGGEGHPSVILFFDQFRQGIERQPPDLSGEKEPQEYQTNAADE